MVYQIVLELADLSLANERIQNLLGEIVCSLSLIEESEETMIKP